MAISLTFLNGPNEGKVIEVPDHLLIGRGEVVDLHIFDTKVSRKHAEITRENGAYILKDIQSKNGTFVNNERITSAALHPGDEIRIGEIRLYISDPTTLLDGIPTESQMSTRTFVVKEKSGTPFF